MENDSFLQSVEQELHLLRQQNGQLMGKLPAMQTRADNAEQYLTQPSATLFQPMTHQSTCSPPLATTCDAMVTSELQYHAYMMMRHLMQANPLGLSSGDVSMSSMKDPSTPATEPTNQAPDVAPALQQRQQKPKRHSSRTEARRRPSPPPSPADQIWEFKNGTKGTMGRSPEDDLFLRKLQLMRERHRRNMALLTEDEFGLQGARDDDGAKANATATPIHAAVGLEYRTEEDGDRPPPLADSGIATQPEGTTKQDFLSRRCTSPTAAEAGRMEDGTSPVVQRSQVRRRSYEARHQYHSPLRWTDLQLFQYIPAKWQPKTCIPKPFNFERREATKPKTIAQRRLEDDVLERIMEEEAIKHHVFRANPVPPNTYLRLVDPDLVEKARKRTQSTKTRSQTPQPRRSRAPSQPTFKPQPPSAAPDNHNVVSAPTDNAVDLLAEELSLAYTPDQGLRVESTQHATAAGPPVAVPTEAEDQQPCRGSTSSSLHVATSLPSRRSSSTPPVGRPSSRRPATAPEFTFHPQINGPPPNWDKLWAKSQGQWARARISLETTEPQEFQFRSKPKAREEVVQHVLKDMAQDERVLREKRWPHGMPKDNTGHPKVSEGDAVVRTTLASKLRNLETLRTLIRKEQRAAEIQREAKERRRRQRDIALRVVPHLPPDVQRERRLLEAERRLENRIKHQEQVLKYKQRLAEVYRRLDETRPFLFVRGEIDRRKQEARATAQRDLREALRAEGLPPDQIELIMQEDAEADEDFMEPNLPTSPEPPPTASAQSLGAVTAASERVETLLGTSASTMLDEEAARRSSLQSDVSYGDERFESELPSITMREGPTVPPLFTQGVQHTSGGPSEGRRTPPSPASTRSSPQSGHSSHKSARSTPRRTSTPRSRSHSTASSRASSHDAQAIGLLSAT